ncbi:carcinoembryonic antigen-related cell adhesion molecule 5 [Sceloporus undulatus]|uniref:carcinoembryonic antigen-related cell adhesion molecule 5 n=1 Tax=Sceloporus undulatus TaxID=8520 RepID=UPI001C4C3962|nr:carcinoembryonic antigen-related cell adhesion molecule 5 [Sceloporus undulatus]
MSIGPNVSYHWLKGGQLIKAGGQMLTLNAATRDDAGAYTCFGNNSISYSYSEPHWLEVFYGPDKPIIEPSEQVYLEHSTLNLSCSASSFPYANYSWYYNGDLDTVQNESRYVIRSLTMGDAGNYTCKVANDVTGLVNNASLEIRVLEPVSNVVITSAPSKVLEHYITTLMCNSAGTDVSYLWLKGNQSLEAGERISLSENNQIVTFNATLRTDSDVYTCYVNNTFSGSAGNYTLTVLYGPDEPIISPDISHYETGSSLNLSCDADSNPPANYTWFFNNHTHEGSNLQIPNLSSNDMGNYTCVASNVETGLNSSQVLEIWVLEPVSNVVITSAPSKVLEHYITTLMCNSAGTDVSYFWLKGNQSLEAGERISLSENNQVVTFNATLRTDSDVYTCYVNNSISHSMGNYTLNVLYGPDEAVISPNSSYYETGSNLSLSCNAASNPPANYTWFVNNQRHEVSNLQISNLTSNNSGKYTCMAANLETNLNSTQVLEIWVVEKLSKPTLWPLSYMPLANEDVLLQCHTSSSPSVSVSWFKDGNPLQAANAVPSGNNRNLTITDFTKADDGNYSCEASNAISKERSDPSVITMAYGPDHVKINQSGDISWPLGTHLVLLCFADSNPAAQFRWFFNSTDTKVMEETFRIGSLTWENGGNYTCQAHNNRTNLTAAVSVTMKVTSEACPGGCVDPGLSPGAIAGIVIGCLAAVILIAGLVYYLCTKTSLGRTERHASNGNISSVPGHNQGATDTKPRTGEEDIQYSTLAFNANSPPQPAPGAGQPLDSNIIYSEIKKK